MKTTETLACGNKPRSAADVSERLDDTIVKFRQQLIAMVERVQESGLEPTSFEALTSGLRAASAEAALSAMVAVVESMDTREAVVVVDGDPHRFRDVAPKQWLSPFGLATIKRRYYASDDHAGGVVPLDAQCGMTDRFMTPEVEEMVAFACSAMTPCEVEQIMAKALPTAPSSTAIKRAIRDVGDFIGNNHDAIEERVGRDAPLSDGANLVVSWDGVMTPIRGNKKTTWKEAGVGRLSIYDPPSADEPKPSLQDSRYFARMPETGMTTLIDQVATRVADLRAQRSFDHVVILCDGKDSIWNTAEKQHQFEGAVLILDFYHASQSLSAAANAIFGEDTPEAECWFERRRQRLLLDDDGVDNLLRALKRYLRILPDDSESHDVVRRAIKHFTKNRGRMKYSSFISMGLPIGSGHIESAAKNIVAHRLKRSGMRWSIEGGQRVLNLRTLVKDGRWDAAWREHLDRRAA